MSAVSKTSCKEPICTSWRTGAKVLSAMPPTRRVGEFSVASSGNSVSMSSSSCSSLS